MKKSFCSRCIYLHEDEYANNQKYYVCTHSSNSRRVDDWYAEKNIRVYEDTPSSINCKNNCVNYKETEE